MSRWFGVMLIATVVACGDDAVGSGGGATDGTEGTATIGADDAASADETTTAPGDDDGPACAADLDCDDADPCTVDACEAGACTHAPITVPTNACRPTIDVDDPPRAATVVGAPGESQVVVTGRVHSGMGPITSLTIDGAPVDVAEDGAFSHAVEATTGGNVVVLETADAAGFTRRRVQSFLYSTAYDLPTTPNEGVSPQALALYLAQSSIDDGDRTPPIDDVASLLQIVFDGFDVSTLFDPNTPIAHYADYDIYITDLTLGDKAIGVQAIDDGLRITARIDDVLGDLEYDCTTAACFFAGGDSTGGFSVTTLEVVALLSLDVDSEHRLEANLVTVDVVIDPDDVEVWSDNAWTNFLISVVEVFVHDQLVEQFESALETTIQQDFGPILTEGLAQIALSLSFDFPNLGDARDPIVVDLAADFADTDFHDGIAPPAPSPPPGGAVFLRGGGYPDRVVSPWDNLGVPRRAGCGAADSTLTLQRLAPFEIGLHDDLLNQLLHAGWRGGLLEFPLSSDQLAGGDGLIEDFEVVVSGMSAPTASDCGSDGALKATIGDIRIDAELTLLGDPVTFVAYTTLVAGIELTPTADGISIGIGAVERVETELTANDEAIELEALLVSSLESQLVDGLLGELGGLGAFTLPDVDVGGLLGLPPGEAVLHIQVEQAEREPGTTVIAAHL